MASVRVRCVLPGKRECGGVSYPWEVKNKTAFMRAGVYAAMDANCDHVS